LHSLAAAVIAYDKPVEILVIDNNSTDDSTNLVHQFAGQRPDLSLRLISEPCQGLSHARNRGMQEAGGDLICFIDDDVIVPERWLTELASTFDLSPQIGCVGGRVELVWPDSTRLPRQTQIKERGSFSSCDYGRESRLLGMKESVVGANFALTRAAAEQVGSFNPALGRVHQCLLSGEETDFLSRLRRNGFLIAYSSGGFLYHKVPAARATVRWLLARNYWQGITFSVMTTRRSPGYVLRYLMMLVYNTLIFCLALLTFNKALIIHRLCKVGIVLGRLRGCAVPPVKHTGEA
jgi:GT2 family glycosyltransferase